MAGMICPVKGCGHSSNDARPPQCAMLTCPGRETFALSDFQRAQNLKKAFVEHDIPWPTPRDVELNQWIEREFAGYGRALRRKEDTPLPDEPWMSMEDAKELTRRAVAAFTAPASPRDVHERDTPVVKPIGQADSLARGRE